MIRYPNRKSLLETKECEICNSNGATFRALNRLCYLGFWCCSSEDCINKIEKAIALITISNKHLINFVCNIKGSSNFRITAENSENKFELKPIEYLNIYKGMNVSEPKGKNKLRKFFPKKISESYLPKIEIDYKPGFLLQSKEFYKMLNSKSKTKLANVKDSINALKLLEQIIK